MDSWMRPERMSYIAAIREQCSCEEIEEMRIRMKHEEGYDAGDALKFAILYRHLEYSEFLLKNHGEESLADRQVCCPLIMLAVRLNYADIVKMICKYSRGLTFDDEHPFARDRQQYVNAPGCLAMEYRRTSLHIAVIMGHHECAKALLQHGADASIEDSNNNIPLETFVNRFYHGEPNKKPGHGEAEISEQTRSKRQRKIKCGFEILKVTDRIQGETWRQLQELFDVCDQKKLVQEFQPNGIPSLMHISRIAIRKALGLHRVPEGIDELEKYVPKILTDYLKLENDS